MFHVWSGWRSRMSVFSIPLSWFRGVTNFMNNFTQGRGIEIELPDNPKIESPVKIKASQEVLDALDSIGKLKTVSAPDEIGELASGTEITSSPGTKKTDSFTAGAIGGSGISLKVLCRSADDGATSVLHFRELIITSDGRIYMVKAESDAQAVFSGQ